jgi:hypothetical protein
VAAGRCATVNVNCFSVSAAPSLTNRVITDEPSWCAAGVMVSVRAVPLPPSTMFDAGTTLMSDDIVSRNSCAIGVSRSPIVNGTTIGVSSGVT